MSKFLQQILIVVTLTAVNSVVANPNGLPPGVLGKPGLPIYIDGSNYFQLALSESKDLDIVLDISKFSGGTLAFSLHADNAVAINSDTSFAYTVDSNQTTLNLPVSIIAYQAGRHYLYFSVQWQEGDKPPQSKTLGVVIQVGEELILQKLQVQRAASETNEQRIKAMPAEERVF